MTTLVIIRLWLVEAIDLIATYAPYDEQLFIRLAKSILEGEWLGPYDQLTLAKGPGYPLFIALVHHTGIPLITAEQLFYSAVCVLVIVALRPLFRSQWPLALIFLLLLFNPFMLSYPALGRVFRLAIYVPLILGIFGLFLGLLLRAKASKLTCAFWSAMLGIFFSYSWYTREEGLWLLPSFVLFALYFLIINSDFGWRETVKRAFCLLLIGGIFAGCTYGLTTLNTKYYGAPIINELKTAEFNSALGGLMNIEGLGSGRFFPVSARSQEAAFAVSPTLAKLKPYLHEPSQSLEYPPAYYVWVFRDAAYDSGYADTLPKALIFYAAIGQEIQAACDSGRLRCLDRKPSIRPVWKSSYLPFVQESFRDVWVRALTFSHYTDDKDEYLKWNSTAPSEVVTDYRIVTRELLTPGHKHHIRRLPNYFLKMKQEKFRILSHLAEVYKKTVPVLFVAALLTHLILIGRSLLRKTLDFEVMSGFIVLSGVTSLISILIYAQSTSLTWAINRPMFSVYPLLLLYISLMVCFLFKSIYKKADSFSSSQK